LLIAALACVMLYLFAQKDLAAAGKFINMNSKRG
jgi:hypothetical protein